MNEKEAKEALDLISEHFEYAFDFQFLLEKMSAVKDTLKGTLHEKALHVFDGIRVAAFTCRHMRDEVLDLLFEMLGAEEMR